MNRRGFWYGSGFYATDPFVYLIGVPCLNLQFRSFIYKLAFHGVQILESDSGEVYLFLLFLVNEFSD